MKWNKRGPVPVFPKRWCTVLEVMQTSNMGIGVVIPSSVHCQHPGIVQNRLIFLFAQPSKMNAFPTVYAFIGDVFLRISGELGIAQWLSLGGDVSPENATQYIHPVNNRSRNFPTLSQPISNFPRGPPRKNRKLLVPAKPTKSAVAPSRQTRAAPVPLPVHNIGPFPHVLRRRGPLCGGLGEDNNN